MMEWSSKWIWHSKAAVVNDFAYFRKVFQLSFSISSAIWRVTGHNTIKVFINGNRVNGYGTPAPTHPWKQKLYSEYDVTSYLKEGTNCLSIDAHYLGGSGQNYVNGVPGIRGELHLKDQQGKLHIIGTDESWETLQNPPHAIGTPYQQNRRLSAVESYNANLFHPSWRTADEEHRLPCYSAVIANDDVWDWPLVKQKIPEGKLHETIVLKKLHSWMTAESEYAQVFDIGQIISGWPKFSLKGINNVTIRMRYSEDLDEHSRVKHNVTNESSSYYYDEYTMRGDSLEEWQPDFSYKAFRYIEVTGYPLPIEEHELVACLAYTDIQHIGYFECSDEHLNQLYRVSIATQKNNTLGQTVDCPHREQAQYLGDTDLQAELLLYNFQNALDVLEKTLSDFQDAQLEDGTFPFVAPVNFEHEDFHIQIPEYDFHFANILWKLYKASGNKEYLYRYYEPLCKMLDYYLSIIDKDYGLIPLDKGWHISDWPYPFVDHKGQFLTVQQLGAVQAIQIAIQIGMEIGITERAVYYEEQMKQLVKHIHHHLYDEAAHKYRDSIDTNHTHQGVTALALLLGIVPQEEIQLALQQVLASEWNCSTVLSLPLLVMLFNNGKKEEAFQYINKRDFPSWGYMIEQGATTLWEGWNDIESHCHAWNGFPVKLLQEYIVGIQFTSIGCTEVIIAPYVPQTLSYAEAAVGSVHGIVKARWEKQNDDKLKISAYVPEGIRATIIWNGNNTSIPSGEEIQLILL